MLREAGLIAFGARLVSTYLTPQCRPWDSRTVQDERYFVVRIHLPFATHAAEPDIKAYRGAMEYIQLAAANKPRLDVHLSLSFRPATQENVLSLAFYEVPVLPSEEEEEEEETP